MVGIDGQQLSFFPARSARYMYTDIALWGRSIRYSFVTFIIKSTPFFIGVHTAGTDSGHAGTGTPGDSFGRCNPAGEHTSGPGAADRHPAPPLEFHLGTVCQGKEGIAVLLLPILSGIGLLGHGNKQPLLPIHDLQVLHHEHSVQRNSEVPPVK